MAARLVTQNDKEVFLLGGDSFPANLCALVGVRHQYSAQRRLNTNENQTHMTLITLAGLIVFAGYIPGGNSAAAALETIKSTNYRGGSAFNLAGVGPNVARCGAFPENIELSFTGQESIRKVATIPLYFLHAQTLRPTASLI